MVFVNTRRAAEEIERHLQKNGINAEAISGDVPQRKRLRMLRDFHEGTLAVLIGTDVASRGLHIPDVSHVFNYDLPQDPEDYVHRIGRTARAGAEGDAISFGCEEYVISLPDIEAYIGRKLPVSAVPQDMLPDIGPIERAPRRFGSGGGQRHGGGGGRGRNGGGGRSGGSRGGGSRGGGRPSSHRSNDRRPEQAAPQPQQQQPSTAAGESNNAGVAEGGNDPQKRRRRRRRRGKPAGEGTATPPPTPPQAE
jgi:ATP-dependent RNA helicase RhlB